MHIHIVAVAGTGMGSLAGLLTRLGHEVSGSDVAFDPPMGPALENWGVRCMHGFEPGNLDPRPDLVVIGNVCRSTNPEARAAIDGGIEYTHIAGALQRFALRNTRPLVVAGTHGKTTTTAIASWLLDYAGLEPGFLVGGIPNNFDVSFRAAKPPALPLSGSSGRKRPFVIEGDEYDTAFFEKTAKFLHYAPDVAIITSIEHDHIDIYPDELSYIDAFERFARLLPKSGVLIVNGADEKARSIASAATCDVAYFAIDGEDTGDITPHWLAAPSASGADGTTFDLFAGGMAAGRMRCPSPGRHNLKNAVAALAAAAQGYGADLTRLGAGLAEFKGVKRRQEVLGEPGGVIVYDDFAHHPTAVRETLAALRGRHQSGRLHAVFEPRSATACRNLHQKLYESSFDAADRVLLAPLGRDGLAPEESLDLSALADELARRGTDARACSSIDDIIDDLKNSARSGDVIALLSNGAFGGIHSRLVKALEPT